MRILALILLLNISSSVPSIALADIDSRICAPFHGVVDPTIINSMLQAAADNNLYRIQQNSSDVGFCVDSLIGRIEAEFKDIKGGLALRREVWGNESQMLVMVDANSLAINDPFIKQLLKSKRFLNTRKFPKILFVSSQIKWLNHENAVLEGLLTLHGITKPVRFDVKMAMQKNRHLPKAADIIVTAKSLINRTDFGMNKLGFLADDEIELCMRVEASLFRRND